MLHAFHFSVNFRYFPLELKVSKLLVMVKGDDLVFFKHYVKFLLLN